MKSFETTDSPIEETFLACLETHIERNLRISTQETIETDWGRFRLDITVFPKIGAGVAFECDGKDYHQNGFRDLFRDAAILTTGKVSGIWRISGGTIHYSVNVAMYCVAACHPKIIGERSRINLEILSRNDDWTQPNIARWRGADLARE